jgi:hypothetical protein
MISNSKTLLGLLFLSMVFSGPHRSPKADDTVLQMTADEEASWLDQCNAHRVEYGSRSCTDEMIENGRYPPVDESTVSFAFGVPPCQECRVGWDFYCTRSGIAALGDLAGLTVIPILGGRAVRDRLADAGATTVFLPTNEIAFALEIGTINCVGVPFIRPQVDQSVPADEYASGAGTPQYLDELALQDLRQSITKVIEAAEAGNRDAQYLLGIYLQYSRPQFTGGVVDILEVRDLYARAAAQGHFGAHFELGKLFHKGVGYGTVPKDLAAAINHYTIAAEAGLSDAMVALANALNEMGGRAEEFVEWSRRAAALGHPGGMNDLGAAYQEAHGGVLRDFERAMQLYRQAADLGSCVAMLNVGGIYYNGDGVSQDLKEAQRWFERAEQCSSASSQIQMTASRYIADIEEGNPIGPEWLNDVNKADQLDNREVLMGLAAIVALMAVLGSGDGGAANSATGHVGDCPSTYGFSCNDGIDMMSAMTFVGAL